MKNRPIIAILDDDEGFCKDVRNILANDAEVQAHHTEGELMEALGFAEPDLLLLDLDLGNEDDGFAVLERLRESGYHFPVMLLTIHAGARTTARAVEYDIPYLNKDRDIEDPKVFRSALWRAIEHHLLKTEVLYYRSQAVSDVRIQEFPWPMLGACRGLKQTLETLGEEAGIAVLVGERGTGKLTAAQWMHQQRRHRSPLVTLTARDRNPVEFEEELYGAAEGGREPGALAAASGGTVIIVGLEELSPDVLHRLQLVAASGSYRPRGAARPQRLSAKIIATCQLGGEELDWPQSLIDAWQACTVELPPLRERKEDLEFHARAMSALRGEGGSVTGSLTRGDLQRLAELPVLGNFHDLALAMSRGVEALERARKLTRRVKKRFDSVNLYEYHDLGWHGAMGALEVALSKSILDLYGSNDKEWEQVTGLSRSMRFKKRRLGREDEEGGDDKS